MNINRKSLTAEIIFVLISVTLYVIASSLVSLNRHWQFNSFWYDFGIFDTTVWKLSRLDLPVIPQLQPPYGKIVWADHFNPGVILLSPLYWLTGKEEIMFVAQSLTVGLSALIAYFISLKFIKSKLMRVSLLVSFLGFTGLQNALYTDVHNNVFVLFPLMLTIGAFFEKKWKLYWIFLLISLGFQENMAAVVTALGFYLLLRKEREVKMGILTVALGLIYGLLTMKLLIPLFNGGAYSYQPSFPGNWYEWITGFFNPPEMKLKSIILTFATFGLLPLGTLSSYPLIVGHYLERFVLNTAATRWDLGFHYNALLSPIMFLASLETLMKLQRLQNLKKLLPFWSILTILTVLYLHRFYLHGPLMLATHPVFYRQTENARFLRDFKQQIPDKGLLMTQNNIAAHFTHGNVILLNKNYTGIKPDTIAVDLRPGQNANNFFPLSEQQTQNLIASVSADPNYATKQVTDSQLIFTRK
ncbi:hypothetical protein A3B48_04140 [Candidatus Gottesmanbacteria bacterium RIFCSPLOWO2_01_FULL_40_10]|uniref:DUF2079 domain-containing protein n=1 Tax=Candidatus Gottesmanbacteria bacterium RIFCSPHIGHO2_01_FULL_40_15 TaxID=1798376 RepID=A0A1F5YZV8_9BACT|nr:MAG: hypothetical protein A2777_05065 [Candidatus Gottesmanbacteria bacterium RIFCSPHIGHO2_01_FULL_40_15]OGG22447.1 MAG: hypothetical protein A3B48_04140 [Candidatus Gottesmanbacteria bacterium RIFCSPLOWO2_01_FULL_40_10]OGG33706.1 MAG: hypothetical protein A3I80_05215 [Candidatus Gottesmanbacteria bacterium RIFCSPLOWO2_02_FULL_40_10]